MLASRDRQQEKARGWGRPPFHLHSLAFLKLCACIYYPFKKKIILHVLFFKKGKGLFEKERERKETPWESSESDSG